ncbi:hypothetical protein FACS189454_05940 [Planctomycetales bacterium]|nr:hypothetical protein FACS189454_05940 [Planctomycetales bacterium]
MDCPNYGSTEHKKDGFANGENNDTNANNAGITIQSKKVPGLNPEKQKNSH